MASDGGDRGPSALDQQIESARREHDNAVDDDAEVRTAKALIKLLRKASRSSAMPPEDKVRLCMEVVVVWDGIVDATADPTEQAKAELGRAKAELERARLTEDPVQIAEAKVGVAEAKVGVAEAKVGVAEAKAGVAEAKVAAGVRGADDLLRTANAAHANALAELERLQQVTHDAAGASDAKHDAGADAARDAALSWPELQCCGELRVVSSRRRRFTNCTPPPGGDPDPLAHEWLTRVWRAGAEGPAVVAKLGGQGVRELEARALLQRTDGLVPLLRCATFHDPVYWDRSAAVMLFPWLRSHHEVPELFYRRDWRVLLRGMLRGLCSLHEVGVAHLDVKPDNVMALGEAGDVVLVDLGLALKVEPGGVAANGWGTPGFRAPEVQLRDDGGGRFGVAADLFSVGATLAHFAHWRRGVPSPVAFDELTATPTLAETLACLTHESPEARGTAEQWLAKLESCDGGVPMPAPYKSTAAVATYHGAENNSSPSKLPRKLRNSREPLHPIGPIV